MHRSATSQVRRALASTAPSRCSCRATAARVTRRYRATPRAGPAARRVAREALAASLDDRPFENVEGCVERGAQISVVVSLTPCAQRTTHNALRLELVRSDSPIKRTARQTKRLGGAAHVAVVATQRFLNQQPLDFLECQVLEPGCRRARAAKAEIVGADLLRLREQYRTLHRVIELANVTGPRMLEKHLHGAGVEPRKLFAVSRGVPPQEVHRERWNVLAPFAQRRQLQLDRIDAKEQVLAKAAGHHFFIESRIRC